MASGGIGTLEDLVNKQSASGTAKGKSRKSAATATDNLGVVPPIRKNRIKNHVNYIVLAYVDANLSFLRQEVINMLESYSEENPTERLETTYTNCKALLQKVLNYVREDVKKIDVKLHASDIDVVIKNIRDIKDVIVGLFSSKTNPDTSKTFTCFDTTRTKTIDPSIVETTAKLFNLLDKCIIKMDEVKSDIHAPAHPNANIAGSPSKKKKQHEDILVIPDLPPMANTDGGADPSSPPPAAAPTSAKVQKLEASEDSKVQEPEASEDSKVPNDNEAGSGSELGDA